jgi:hypothetical protein
VQAVTYDWQKDFEPVAMIGTNVNVLVVNPSLPVTDFNSFIAYAKANPGKLNYGTSGSGTGAHILIEYLKQKTGFKAEHIPTRARRPAITDLIGGRTQFAFDPAVTAQVQAGKLKAIAISGAKSLDLLPGVPPIENFVRDWGSAAVLQLHQRPGGNAARDPGEDCRGAQAGARGSEGREAPARQQLRARLHGPAELKAR